MRFKRITLCSNKESLFPTQRNSVSKGEPCFQTGKTCFQKKKWWEMCEDLGSHPGAASPFSHTPDGTTGPYRYSNGNLGSGAPDSGLYCSRCLASILDLLLQMLSRVRSHIFCLIGNLSPGASDNGLHRSRSLPLCPCSRHHPFLAVAKMLSGWTGSHL